MNFEERYGRLDRLLHDIAFRTGRAQHALADVEEMLFRDELREIELEDPVSVTALPRSGTTILLRLLHDTGRFAAHTYRDMPFVLCPMLWSRFTRHFGVDDRPTERAHGDGIEVSTASPEAFEEVIWKHFWADHYLDDRIVPWTSGEVRPEFDEFFRSHMRKIALLRREDEEERRRYLSKNNVNVARLAALPPSMRGVRLVIPFREPVQHAASLLRQHERFSRIQETDDFVRRYMAAIGHHEFGKELRPVDFGGWLEGAPSPERLEFWIRYWIATYTFVLEEAGSECLLVSYRRLTDEPEASLGRIADAIEIPERALCSQAGRIRSPREHDVRPVSVSSDVLDRASELRALLEERAEG